MKISLITASYNSEDSIQACLDSISEQSFKAIEHLVIDGRSKDKTCSIVAERSPASILISEEDQGVYDALNKGIELSKGDVIGFLHSDDRFSGKDVLSRIAELFKDEKIDGIYGDLEYVRKNDVVLRYWRAGEYSSRSLTRGWMPPHPTLFLRRSVYDEVGKFNTTFKIASDYQFILRLLSANKYKLLYIPESLVRMNVGGISNRSFKNILQKSSEDYRALRSAGMPFPFGTLLFKNIRKLPQFLANKL